MDFSKKKFIKWFAGLDERQAQEFVESVKQLGLLRSNNKDSAKMRKVLLSRAKETKSGQKKVILKSSDNYGSQKSKSADTAIYNLVNKLGSIFDQEKDVICVKNTSSVYVGFNKMLLRFGEFPARNRIIGTDDFHMPWREGAEFYRKLDRGVLKGKRYKTLMSLRVTTGEKKIVLQDKFPLIDKGKNIRGVVFKMREVTNLNFLKKFRRHCSSKSILPELKNYMANKFLIKKTYLDSLTETESICFFYVLRGYTAKDIANIVSRSDRTIENHLNNIKQKLGFYNKSQLMMFGIENGFLNIIPERILYSHLEFTY